MKHNKNISRLHYLTQDMPGISHAALTEIACRSGVRWIQLRVKNKPGPEWIQIAETVKKICDRYNAKLIINDNVEVARAVDAHGIHLGKKDMHVRKARQILGNDKIIGGTANTLEDMMELQSAGVDYIGLGPFRFTSTKENLSPVLGLEGYSYILSLFKSPLPVIAIGGITINDVQPLLDTGVYGIAVSSAINTAIDKEKMISDFLHATGE